MLELAVLGLLRDAPLHGYELRTRLRATLGAFRAFSYGSLYPTLRRMQEAGWIAESDGDAEVVAGAPALTGRRGKVVYECTPAGRTHLESLLRDAGPAAWEDEAFGVRFSLFARTDPHVRVRVLEGRRARLAEREEGLRAGLTRTRDRLDAYTLKLQEHGLEAVEREVRWLSELLDAERAALPALPSPADPPLSPSPEPASATPTPVRSTPRLPRTPRTPRAPRKAVR